MPGIPPAEAVSRLQDFQQRYLLYDSKRKTLDSVSKLFGIVCKPFPELDKTGEVKIYKKYQEKEMLILCIPVSDYFYLLSFVCEAKLLTV